MTATQITDRLIACGCRPTQQRIAVYDYLLSHRVHPTAEEIYCALQPQYPVLSRTTVYNSLHALQDVGLVRTLSIDAAEQRFDADTSMHGHFQCRVCGAVTDFVVPNDLIANCSVQGSVETADVYLIGVCQHCTK